MQYIAKLFGTRGAKPPSVKVNNARGVNHATDLSNGVLKLPLSVLQ